MKHCATCGQAENEVTFTVYKTKAGTLYTRQWCNECYRERQRKIKRHQKRLDNDEVEELRQMLLEAIQAEFQRLFELVHLSALTMSYNEIARIHNQKYEADISGRHVFALLQRHLDDRLQINEGDVTYAPRKRVP